MTNSNRFNLAGRRALVTGSSRGIGAAIAIGLAEAGADVIVHFAGNRQAAAVTADKIQAFGRPARLIQADLGTDTAPADIMQQAGAIDILVANASVQIPEPWREVSREHFDRQVAVNWRSAFELIQLATPTMLENGWGRILTVGSVQESKPHPDMVVYASLKAAQTLMVKNLASQFAAHGVTINNLAPGVILTDRNTGRLADADYARRVKESIPAGVFGEPEDCVGAALLLCSDAGRYITGQNLYVDGGMGRA
jgi:glucose 1-dehydrogenase